MVEAVVDDLDVDALVERKRGPRVAEAVERGNSMAGDRAFIGDGVGASVGYRLPGPALRMQPPDQLGNGGVVAAERKLRLPAALVE